MQFLMYGLAALAGLTMAVQGSVNSALSKITGLLHAALIVHIIGTVIAAAVVFFPGNPRQPFKLAAAPWYSYLGGVLNVLIIVAVSAAICRLGVASATTAIIVGQVLTAVLIDHLGVLGATKVNFCWYRLSGLALFAAGAWLLLSMNKAS